MTPKEAVEQAAIRAATSYATTNGYPYAEMVRDLDVGRSG